MVKLYFGVVLDDCCKHSRVTIQLVALIDYKTFFQIKNIMVLFDEQ